MSVIDTKSKTKAAYM